MFFILRCVFWLGLVFAHIDWTSGGTSTGGEALARPLMRKAVSEASAGVRDYCTQHVQDCLGALIGSTAKSGDATAEAASDKPQVHLPAPAMPMPRPRAT